MKLLSAIFREEISDYTYPFSRRVFLRILAILVASGVAIWLLALAFDKFMITPVFCANAEHISICANSTSIASYVALVLTGIMLVPVLAVFGIKRPLLVVIAATVSLWGATLWAGGSWILSLLWVVLATVLVYLSLIWLNRIRGNGAAILFMTLFVLQSKISELKNQSSVELIKTDVVELGRTIAKLNESVSDKLERSNAQVQTSVQKQLSESAKLVTDVTQRLAKLDETNKRVVDVATDLKTLQNVLQNPKQRGVFGEFYLESVLDNVLPAKQYQMQYRFKDGEIVDAVIFLDKGQVLPVDSKFSLENYNRMINAETKSEREMWLNKVKADLKGRIDETSKYIRPRENTMDFAFMFIPSESLYYDLLINNVGQGGSSRDLIEYAFRDKRVIIVSPTSFLAYLQTVLQGLRSLQIEEQAKDIQVRVGQLGVHIKKFDELMTKMGKSLSTTVGHYNNTYKELGKIDKDVVRISGGNNQAQPELIDRPTQED